MSWVSLTAIACFFWLRFRTRCGLPVPRIARVPPSVRVTALCAISLVVLFFLQAQILLLQVRAEMPAGRGVTLFPLPVYNATTYDPGLHPIVSYFAFGVGAFELVALALLCLAVAHGIARPWRVVAPIVVSLAVIALCTPALSTTDPYEYGATSLLGFASYTPPAHAFDGTSYERFERILPLRGVIYGPLWVGVDTLTIGWVPSILGKVLALRAINMLLLGVLSVLFARAKLSKATIVALVANPGVWYYVVLNPHADIEGLVCLAGVFLYAKRARPWIAVALLTAAGLIKITFLIAGAAALAPLESVRRRVTAFGIAVVATAVGSLLVPHNAYLRDLLTYTPHAAKVTAQIHGSQWWTIAAGLAILGSIALLVARVRFAPVAWLFAQLAPYGAPWYLLWGLPYAAATGCATALLVTLPLVAAALDASFNTFPLPMLVFAAVTLGFLIDVLRARTRVTAPARG